MPLQSIFYQIYVRTTPRNNTSCCLATRQCRGFRLVRRIWNPTAARCLCLRSFRRGLRRSCNRGNLRLLRGRRIYARTRSLLGRPRFALWSPSHLWRICFYLILGILCWKFYYCDDYYLTSRHFHECKSWNIEIITWKGFIFSLSKS